MGIIIRHDEVELSQSELHEAIRDFVLKKYGRAIVGKVNIRHVTVTTEANAVYSARADLEDPEPTTPQIVNTIEVVAGDGQKFQNILPRRNP